jgi:hypothetical protein
LSDLFGKFWRAGFSGSRGFCAQQKAMLAIFAPIQVLPGVVGD